MTRYEEELNNLLKDLGLGVLSSQASLLMKHLELVCAKNKELNLTRIVSLEEGIILHVIDSLLCLPHLRSLGNELTMIDIGTGGGYPGIPLAICSDFNVTMLDSVGKKASAVGEFIRELGLQDRCTAIGKRSEELAKEDPESFDIVVARAVAQTNVLIEYAAPLLKQAGTLCAMKAHISDDELHAAEKAAEVCGLEIVSRETFELPQGFGHREIIYIEKTGTPSIALPRRNGMAVKRPLGV